MMDRPTPTQTLEAIRLFLEAKPKLPRRLHRPLDTIIAAARTYIEDVHTAARTLAEFEQLLVTIRAEEER